MRRLWLLPVAAALLGACGSLGAAPAPTAADLLAAPTTLQVGGRRLQAEAAPHLKGENLGVRVRVRAAQSTVPPLAVTDVYMVTDDGVWSAAAQGGSRPACGGRCLQGTGRGEAGSLRPGDGVQVVVRLQDPRGRALWLRDAQARVE